MAGHDADAHGKRRGRRSRLRRRQRQERGKQQTTEQDEGFRAGARHSNLPSNTASEVRTSDEPSPLKRRSSATLLPHVPAQLNFLTICRDNARKIPASRTIGIYQSLTGRMRLTLVLPVNASLPGCATRPTPDAGPPRTDGFTQFLNFYGITRTCAGVWGRS